MDFEKRTITLPASIVTKVRESLDAADTLSDSEVIVQALERFGSPMMPQPAKPASVTFGGRSSTRSPIPSESVTNSWV